MIHAGIYFVVLAGVCLYAMIEGGQPERWTASIIAICTVATFLLPFDPDRNFHTVEIGELAIDLCMLAGLVWIAATANRFWPMWLAALHLLAIGVHGVKGYQPDLMPPIYAAATGKIGYGLLILVAAGVYRHKARLARYGKDRDWSWGAT